MAHELSILPLQGVGQALWACGRLRHHPGVLAGSVLLDLRRRGAEYALEDWTVIVWALTSVGHNTREYLQLAHHMVTICPHKHIHPLPELHLFVWLSCQTLL